MMIRLAQAVEDYLRACEQAHEAQVEHASASRIVRQADNRLGAALDRRDHLKVTLQTLIDTASQHKTTSDQTSTDPRKGSDA